MHLSLSMHKQLQASLFLEMDIWSVPLLHLLVIIQFHIVTCFASDDLWKAVVFSQPPSLLIGKVLAPVMHFCASSVLESRLEARIVQIDFSAAFDRVNHQGILYKLCSVGT